jgi:hypothetical protein
MEEPSSESRRNWMTVAAFVALCVATIVYVVQIIYRVANGKQPIPLDDWAMIVVLGCLWFGQVMSLLSDRKERPGDH